MTATTTLSRELKLAIFAGCMISFISFGFSASFSVFLRPMSIELGWGREVFSLSLAIQALMWGITQPLAGMYADKHGSSRVLAFGAVVAALGFALRGVFDDQTLFILTGFIVGVGTGACSFPVVIVALGKVVQYRRVVFVRLVRTGLSKTKTPLWHLSDTCNRYHPIYHGPDDRQQRSILFGRDGNFVAIHRTADHRINRADPRIAVSVHIGGSCVL